MHHLKGCFLEASTEKNSTTTPLSILKGICLPIVSHYQPLSLFFIFNSEDEDTPEPEPTTDKTATVSVQPSLGDATVSEVTPDSLLLSWSVQEGSFDSFIIQYEDATGKPQVLPVDGTMRSLHLYNLMPSQRYKFTIYGVSGYNRLGPISTEAVTGQQ